MTPSVKVKVPATVKVLLSAMILVPPAILKVTLKKVAVDGVIVTPLLVSNCTVPELWVKVGEPEMVKVLETCRFPLVLVKVPPDKAYVPLTSMVVVPPVNVPAACEKFPVVIATFWVMVPV